MALVRGEAAEIFGKTISVKLLKMLVLNAVNDVFSERRFAYGGPCSFGV